MASRNHGRWCRTGAWIGASAALLMVLSLVPYLSAPAELTRMRNALLLDPEPADYDWAPGTKPADFKVDPRGSSALFSEIVRRHALVVPGDDWGTAIRIGRHLLSALNRPSATQPIQSDLRETYRRIVDLGQGYCGDFADVFTGLATAAGLFTRPWAFSFDGFGGRGHIFNEVWDRQAQSWRMIDVFYNQYPVDRNGGALSASAFREALANGEAIHLVPVDPGARPGFIDRQKAIAYYRRGLSEGYMWWGNNVFEYDENLAVRLFGAVSRSTEQLAGIAVGVHPRIRILHAPENAAQREAMNRLGIQLRFIALGLPLALFSAVACAAVSRTCGPLRSHV